MKQSVFQTSFNSQASCLHASFVSAAWSDFTMTKGLSYAASLLNIGYARTRPLYSSLMTWTRCSFPLLSFCTMMKSAAIRRPNWVVGSRAPLSSKGSCLNLLTFLRCMRDRLQIGHAGFFGQCKQFVLQWLCIGYKPTHAISGFLTFVITIWWMIWNIWTNLCWPPQRVCKRYATSPARPSENCNCSLKIGTRSSTRSA